MAGTEGRATQDRSSPVSSSPTAWLPRPCFPGSPARVLPSSRSPVLAFSVPGAPRGRMLKSVRAPEETDR